MGYIYAVKNNVMAIRADDTANDDAHKKQFHELFNKLQEHKDKIDSTYRWHIPAELGFYIDGNFGKPGFFAEAEKPLGYEMMLIQLNDNNISSSSMSDDNKSLKMKEILDLAKSLIENLRETQPSQFDSFALNGAESHDPKPSKEIVKSLLTAFNLELQAKKSSDSEKVLKSLYPKSLPYLRRKILN